MGRERDRERDHQRHDGSDRRDRDYRGREHGRDHRDRRSRSRSRERDRREHVSGHHRQADREHDREPRPPLLSPEEALKKQREDEQAVLDAQMEERRRRVEEWRKKRQDQSGVKMDDSKAAEDEEQHQVNEEAKAWTFEDDEDDVEEKEVAEDVEMKEQDPKLEVQVTTQQANVVTPAVIDAAATKEEPEEEDVDPLDAFMASNEVQLIKDVEDPMVVEKALFEPETSSVAANQPIASSSSPPNLPPIILKPKNLVKGQIKIGQASTLQPIKSSNAMAPKAKAARARKSSDESSSESDVSSEEEDDAEWARLLNAGKLSKGDKLVAVDHSTINYRPFRKNFYIEVPEMSRLSDAEIGELRKEMDGIKVRGKNVPKPIRSWNQAGLSGKLLDVLRKSGFAAPLPIQAQALPIIMSGRDCIGIAKTGSGKTLGFVLPLMRHVKDQHPVSQGEGPIALLMAPTRELVQQISKEIRKFAKVVDMSCVAVFGGSGVANQISELKRGAEIVVCTPGRMIDLLATSNGKITNLQRCTFLVLDEADRMFDMGFEPQIMRIVQNIRPDRQTVLFSATFPRQVEALARKVLIDPIEIQVGGRSVVNSDIEQVIEIRPEQERFLRLLEILGEWYEQGKVLIFVQSQDKCDSLFRDLLKYGYPCLSLHGGKDQGDRECTVADFKGDVCNVLVATSVAARGLDVKDLVLVLNYDVPNHHEDYVHRVGRTGRAGNKGTAITFISQDEDRYAPDLVKAMRESGCEPPQDLIALANGFNEKRRQGLVHGHGSGYGGSGFKFDNSEQDQYLQARKAQAKELGGGAVAEEEEPQEEHVFDEDGFAVTKAKPEAPSLPPALTAAKSLEQAPSAPNPITLPQPSSQVAALLSNAQLVAARIAPQGQQLPMGAMAPPPPVSQPSALSSAMLAAAAAVPGVMLHAAAQRAAAIAGSIAGAAPGRFFAELEVNDFPQQARWKVTHRETMLQIAELTGCAVIVKGVFVPPGKAVPEGERKIFLLIEGPNDAAVKKAKTELKKVIEEQTERAMRKESGAGGGAVLGRYTV